MYSAVKEICVCTGGGCIASGSLEIAAYIKETLKGEGFDIRVKCTGCLGPCSHGPVMKTLNDNIVYEELTKEKIDRIVQEHIVRGIPVDEYRLNKGDMNNFFSLQKKIVLRNCGKVDPLDIEDSLSAGVYRAEKKVLGGMSPEDVIQEIKLSGLRGRGGAGFPTWMKWQFTRDADGDEKFVICNADEGDPGAFMDRSLLEGDPHTLIEGMVIAARAIGGTRGFVYVRAEYPLAVSRLQKAIESARMKGFLGKNILGSGFSFDMEIRMGSGAFVCGEETALMASLEGKRGEPRPRPPFPAIRGLWDKPSLLNNVETYANIAYIINRGAADFASVGVEKTRGTKIFALAGAVENTGLVEVPMGTTLGELIYDIGGGIKNGKEFKAAQIGGPSGGCIPKQNLNVPLDYENLKELGAIMGSGGLIVMDDESCMVDVARFFLEFVQEESCGKCVPCRVGTLRMLEILERICAGRGEMEDLETLVTLGEAIGETSLCGLGQTAPNPVLSTLRHFRDEYVQHIRDRHCEAGVCPELVRAPCQSACPASVDVPGFVSLVGEGRYAEALKLHRERNPFAAVCARVCFHTCEDKCRRATLDESVSIRAVKRYMVDQEVVIQAPDLVENAVNEKKKIAVVGAGPAGLSCAYFLARMGYRPDVFESGPRPGGMLVQAIPAYRLPRETMAREIRMIENMGARLKTDMRMGRDFTLDSLEKEGYEAVFLGIGASQSLSLGIPGEHLEGIDQALAFLRQYNIRGSVKAGKNVVVIGGGNAAIDAARTALRLGSESVKIVYRRSQEMMPAYEEEVEEALSEGVTLIDLMQPLEFIPDEKGRLKQIRCMPMKLGDFDRSGRRSPHSAEAETVYYDTDQVILALGQRMDRSVLPGKEVLELSPSGFIKADPVSGQTSLSHVFAGGDNVDGPSSVVSAIGAGERAAVGMDKMLTGEEHAFWRWEKESAVDYDPESDPLPYERERLPVLPEDRRIHNFDEVEQCWNSSVAHRQAKRCLRCDYGKKVRVREKEESHV